MRRLALLAAFAAPAIIVAQPPSASPSFPLVVGETFTMPSRHLGETRRINVYAARGWSPDTARPLPVLYMPDGGMAEDFLHVAGLLQVLVGNGTMRPFLLVGIENTQRRRDLSPPTRSRTDSAIAPRVGGSAAFRAFVRDELKPLVATRYRVTRESAIVGESLAGLFVVETFLLEPGLFDTYVAFDPSLWWDDGRLVDGARGRLVVRSTAGQRLWIASSGDGDRGGHIARLVAQLAQGRVPDSTFHHEPMPAETHATIYHPAALRAFRALFAPAPATSR